MRLLLCAHAVTFSGHSESLKFIVFVVFLFCAVRNCKSALSEEQKGQYGPLCNHLLPLSRGLTRGGPRGHLGNTSKGCPNVQQR